MTRFVDTGAWVAMASSKDPDHAAAVRFARQDAVHGGMVTSEAVLGEAVTVLRFRWGHASAVGFMDSLTARTGGLQIVYSDAGLRDEALAIFRKAADQKFSYVDCLSFAIMRRLGLREVFSFDRDFARFGFAVVPGSA